MRRQFRALVFAGLVGTCGAPIAAASPVARETATSQAPVAVQRVAVPSTEMRDEVAMVLVGTILIGLASLVRRAA